MRKEDLGVRAPLDEARRPGIFTICAGVRVQHSDWSDDQVVTEAKAIWHRRYNKRHEGDES